MTVVNPRLDQSSTGGFDDLKLCKTAEVFNDQLLIKRADNVPRKGTKYPPEYIHLLWE